MSSDPNIGVQPRGAQPLPLFFRALGASSQSGPVAGASRAEGRCRGPNEGDGGGREELGRADEPDFKKRRDGGRGEQARGGEGAGTFWGFLVGFFGFPCRTFLVYFFSMRVRTGRGRGDIQRTRRVTGPQLPPYLLRGTPGEGGGAQNPAKSGLPGPESRLPSASRAGWR